MGKEGTEIDLGKLAELRQRTYLLFGTMFHYPEDEQLEQAIVSADEMSSSDGLARGFPFYRCWREALAFLLALDEAGKENLQEEYVSLFLAAISHSPCPLYESAFRDRTGREKGWIVAELDRAYAAAGFRLSDGAGGELPDHIGLELEFMSLLCAQEAKARRRSNGGEANAELSSERSFLSEHLERWIAPLAYGVKRATEEVSFYRLLAAASHAFVVHDGDLIDALSRDEASLRPTKEGTDA